MGCSVSKRPRSIGELTGGGNRFRPRGAPDYRTARARRERWRQKLTVYMATGGLDYATIELLWAGWERGDRKAWLCVEGWAREMRAKEQADWSTET